MRKRIFTQLHLVIISFFIFHTSAFAQSEASCGTDIMRKKAIEQNPEILNQEAQLEEFTKTFTEQYEQNASTARSATYIIPVVFHIIHDYGTENITDEQIFDAIDRMNQDYSKTNADFDATITEFLGIAADCQIEFRLAQKNLGGGCVNGIERIPSMLTYNATDDAKLNPWQPGHYLNIWVAKVLPEGVAAYAYYPGAISGFLAMKDGIICLSNFVGGIGTSSEYYSHTLSHEAGHWMNLQHPWGNTNDPGVECGDDQVSDTPVTKGSNLVCNLSLSTCNPPIIENVQNFMEYSYCETMFTEGQKTRMFAALNSETANRSTIWSEENLILTGTNDGYVPGTCAPVADFYSDSRFVCAGSAVTFHDVSWNGGSTSRTWTFEGGSPSTSTDENPSVTFSEKGWHKVTLEASSSGGSNTKSVDEYIYVSTDVIYNDTYYGDFNDETQAREDWVFYNKYQDSQAFDWRSNNGYGGSNGCAWLNSRFGPFGDKDELISPSFNLDGSAADSIFFRYSTTSYSPAVSYMSSTIKLWYSIDCGKTWTQIFSNILEGEELFTAYSGDVNFVPIHTSQWRTGRFSIPILAKNANVKFKIEFTYDSFSNNVFIDDFNFSSAPVAIEDATSSIGTFNIAPNPASSQTSVNVEYNLEMSGNVTLSIYDLLGNIVADIPLGEQPIGMQHFTLNLNNYHIATGNYLFKLSDGNSYQTQKMTIE